MTLIAPDRPPASAEPPFTDEQRLAIDHRDGPMLLSANAGSGKTAVLTERFVLAVLEDGLAPSQLLAITFTDKAAGELRARVRGRFAQLGAREAARETEGAWISTIHGFCTRVLRSHAVAAGLDPAFTVLDEAQARSLRALAFERALARLMGAGARPEALDLAAAWGVDRLRTAVLDVHDQLRSRGRTAPALPPWRPRHTVEAALARLRVAHEALAAEATGWRAGLVTIDEARAVLGECAEGLDLGETRAERLAGLKLGARVPELKTPAAQELRAACAGVREALDDEGARATHALLDELLRDHAATYAALKRERSGVDYDDLELMVRDLLDRQPGVAAAYRERFARIMVDEFQDTNPLQLALLTHLDRGQTFFVGDELQSIYGFRHADVGVFRAKHREHEALGAAPELATNWRSRPELLATVNAAWGAGHDRYVPLRAGLQDGDADGPLTELLLTDARFDDDAEVPDALRRALSAGMPPVRSRARLAEARAVARRVRGLVDGGHAEPRDVAILLRAATDLHVFERALELEGLSTLASGGRGYWLRQPVQDLTSYLAVLANPRDDASLLAALASPLAGVGSDGLALLAQAARDGRPGLWAAVSDPDAHAVLGPADRAAVQRFAAWVRVERDGAPRRGLDVLIARVVAWSAYDLHVLRQSSGRRRLANVHKLERLAADFEAANGRDVRGFIDHATAEVEADAREPQAPIELGDRQAVQLMTVHAAKGLQFGVVVLADLGRRGRATLPDVLVDDDRVGLRVVRPGHPSGKALDYEALEERLHAAQLAEERRVMHVAVTRAQERLVLSGVAALGADWPAPKVSSAPLAWLGAGVDPALPFRLTARQPVLELDRHVGEHRLRVRATLNAPETSAATLGFVAPEPEQLSLLDAPPALPAPSAHGLRTVRSPWALDGEAPAAPPPPATLSYSALTHYAACPYRHHLRRHLRLPDKPPPEGDEPPAPRVPGATLDKLTRGSVAHKVLEDGGPATAEGVLAAAQAIGAEPQAADLEELAGLLAAWDAGALAGRLRAARRVHREQGFAFPLDPGDPAAPMVTGVVDVLAEEDEGMLVVDYKTNPVAGVDLAALTERDYGVQRRIYALAVLASGAERVEIAHAYLERPAEPVVVAYGPGDADGLRARLGQEAGGLLRGAYPVTPRPHLELCGTCPGRGGLCSYPEAVVLQPLAASPGPPEDWVGEG